MAYNNFKIESLFQELALEKKYYKLQSDRLKNRKFVYNSFPLVHKNSIEMNDLRSFVYADAYARYLSYRNNNVLFTLGINNTSKKIYDSVLNNVLSKEDPYTNLKGKCYHDLSSMDIIFDTERKNESHSKSFISFMQEAFLSLYNYDFITKEYDDFYLDFTSIKDDVLLELEKCNMLEPIKEYLDYKSGVVINFETTVGEVLEVLVQEPEYLTGVNFIAIKPSAAYKHFYLDSEVDYINNTIKNKKNIGVFSGNFAINPLTNEYIPIVISHHYKRQIHLGIPNLYDEDLFFSSIFGFEYNLILSEEKTFINSGFLNGCTLKEGHNKAVEYLQKNNNVQTFESYNNTRFLISTEFIDGIAIPFFENDIVKYESLPVLIDSKNNVRIVNGKLPKEKMTNKVFTTNITQAFMSIASRVRSSIGMVKYGSREFVYEINEFPKFDYAIFQSKADYAFTLVLNIIILKTFNIDFKNVISKFVILNEIPETKNMLELNAIITRFGACSVRKDMMSINITDNYFYNIENVASANCLIDRFVEMYSFEVVTEFKDLEKSYSALIENATSLVELVDFPVYIELLSTFIDKVYEYKKITSRQAKGLLVLFSLIAPSICEHIHNEMFNKRYPLMFSSWPS